ncbi:hypothetical protein Dimus_032985 [Dionaea muscipula]
MAPLLKKTSSLHLLLLLLICTLILKNQQANGQYVSRTKIRAICKGTNSFPLCLKCFNEEAKTIPSKGFPFASVQCPTNQKQIAEKILVRHKEKYPSLKGSYDSCLGALRDCGASLTEAAAKVTTGHYEHAVSFLNTAFNKFSAGCSYLMNARGRVPGDVAQALFNENAYLLNALDIVRRKPRLVN